MSEYQYYEFLAIDRPLTSKERDAIRQFSTRAEISSTSFTNEYHWGNFKGDPQPRMLRMRSKYFPHIPKQCPSATPYDHQTEK